MKLLPPEYQTRNFTQAANLRGLSPDDRRNIATLEAKIPQGMQGIFKLSCPALHANRSCMA